MWLAVALCPFTPLPRDEFMPACLPPSLFTPVPPFTHAHHTRLSLPPATLPPCLCLCRTAPACCAYRAPACWLFVACAAQFVATTSRLPLRTAMPSPITLTYLCAPLFFPGLTTFPHAPTPHLPTAFLLLPRLGVHTYHT